MMVPVRVNMHPLLSTLIVIIHIDMCVIAQKQDDKTSHISSCCQMNDILLLSFLTYVYHCC